MFMAPYLAYTHIHELGLGKFKPLILALISYYKASSFNYVLTFVLYAYMPLFTHVYMELSRNFVG